MSESWIVKWHEQQGVGHRRWFFRRICADGTYFGEIEQSDPTVARQKNLEGELSKVDAAEFKRMAKAIQSKVIDTPAEILKEGWTGLFASGPVSKPQILFQYRTGDETSSNEGVCFRRIIEILRPYATF